MAITRRKSNLAVHSHQHNNYILLLYRSPSPLHLPPPHPLYSTLKALYFAHSMIMKPAWQSGRLLCPITLLAFTNSPSSALSPTCTRRAASSHASVPPNVMHFPSDHSRRALPIRSVSSRSPIHLSSSRSSNGEEFDEAAFESDRLAKDAIAMAEMKSQAEEEYAKLRTPWKWRIRKAVWDFMEEKDIAQFPR